jgi:ferredoxin
MLGHLGHDWLSGEHSPLRLALMRVFARFIEVPVLFLSYHACVGRLRFLSRWRLARWLLLYPIAFPFGHYGDTGRPYPTDRLVEMVRGLEGPIAVGPCRCRVGHKACGHPMETDIVIRTGTDVWLKAFPREYRVIDREEAVRIIEECAALGMFHMVFLHCLIGGAMNEYVICNCCTDGCVPYILNRELGQDIYPLVRGDQKADADAKVCVACGTCVEVCPFAARALAGEKPAVLDCFGCGLCAARCTSGATRMRSSPG